mgnify:FL=1
MRELKSLPILAFFLCFTVCSMLNEALASYVVHGNYKSRIYHNPPCRYFNCKACTVVFQSAKEARVNGYRACKVWRISTHEETFLLFHCHRIFYLC